MKWINEWDDERERTRLKTTNNNNNKKDCYWLVQLQKKLKTKTGSNKRTMCGFDYELGEGEGFDVYIGREIDQWSVG